MRAVRWHGPRDIRVETVTDPTPGRHDVVLRVAWCGICGTDVDEYLTGPHWIPTTTPNPLTGARAPLILGHEFTGEVVAIGKEVRDLRVGDHVAPDTLIYCGHCYWCQRHQVHLCESLAALGLMADGGLAEFCSAPAQMCVRLPETLPLDHAALAEPLAVAIHALRRGRLAPGETVAIVGAGPVGLCALQAALHSGARRVVVVEPDAARRQVALALGATVAVEAAGVAWHDVICDAVQGPGPDLTIECGGHVSSVAAALDVARRGGRIVIVGFPSHPSMLDFATLAASEKELIGSLSHVYDEDSVAAVDLLSDGRVQVDALITHRLPLDRVVDQGFERLASGDRDAIKILVTPTQVAV